MIPYPALLVNSFSQKFRFSLLKCESEAILEESGRPKKRLSLTWGIKA